MEFVPFPKVPRLSRGMVITEKLDGTNASVFIKSLEAWDTAIQEQKDGWLKLGDSLIRAGSRNRFTTPDDDNYGFARWVHDNAEELVKLGPGTHYGEWWGQGIQRGYGLDEKRFSLFNVGRWFRPKDDKEPEADAIFAHENGLAFAPSCCHVVPALHRGPFGEYVKEAMCGNSECRFERALNELALNGSIAAPGFMKPEGIMIYHTAARQYFKKTFENDVEGKG